MEELAVRRVRGGRGVLREAEGFVAVAAWEADVDGRAKALGLAVRGALAGSAKGVIQTMSRDHERAADHGDRYFVRMRRQPVAEPGCSGDATQAAKHQQERRRTAVLAKTDQ